MLYIWLGIIVFAVIIELITTDLVSIWFAGGALTALITYALELNSTVQITVFIVVSAILIVITRPIAKKYLRTNIVSTNYDRVIGKHGLVLKEITENQKGEVKVLSSEWAASGINNTCLQPGDYCEILAVEGNHLIVRKIEKS